MIERIIFNARWTLIGFYLGLIVVLGLYLYTYVRQIISLVLLVPDITTEEMTALVLNTLDGAMIGNLITMVMWGSYHSFVSKRHDYKDFSITSGNLKNKIASSVIVVSIIHLVPELLKGTVEWDVLYKQLHIFGMFLIASLVLGVLEYLHIKGEAMEHAQKHTPVEGH